MTICKSFTAVNTNNSFNNAVSVSGANLQYLVILHLGQQMAQNEAYLVALLGFNEAS